MGMLDSLFKKTDGDGEGKAYVKARKALENNDDTKMRKLAEKPDTHPEMLYYLAQQGDDDTRSLVAANASTPIQADELLTDDDADDVRAALALKIGRLMPDMSAATRGDVGERSLKVLEKLAADQLPKVRAIVAEAIKSSPHVPPMLVARLARDVETIVSAPVLEYSPLLSDEDLREIIAAGTADGALQAIAKRANLSGDVCDDIAATLDVPAVSALLTNKSAQIREETLDAIIDNAPQEQAWHQPLSHRAGLSMRAMKRISGFVASYLVMEMMEHNDLPDDAAEDILQDVRARIADERVDDDIELEWETQAQAHHEAGEIDDSFIRDAIKANKRGLILHCLAAAADIGVDDVKSIINSKDGKVVTALAWKAGLNMRTAFQIQRAISLISGPELLYAKDGIDYPLEDEALDWIIASYVND